MKNSHGVYFGGLQRNILWYIYCILPHIDASQEKIFMTFSEFYRIRGNRNEAMLQALPAGNIGYNGITRRIFPDALHAPEPGP